MRKFISALVLAASLIATPLVAQIPTPPARSWDTVTTLLAIVKKTGDTVALWTSWRLPVVSNDSITLYGLAKRDTVFDTTFVTLPVVHDTVCRVGWTCNPPAPVLNTLQISPKTSALLASASQVFTATAKWTDSSTTLPTITWTATGGTVTNGNYSAPSVAGIYKVIVAGAGKADTATVTVTTPPPPPPVGTCTRTVPAATGAALISAATAALPGDCIKLVAGTYTIPTQYWVKSGTAAKPIVLEGVGSASVITTGPNGGIYLQASYWKIRKLRVTNGFFGIQTEGSAYTELDSIEIDNVKQAAINLRYGTNHSIVKNSKIHDTGKGTKRYGEGVYIGGYASAGSSATDNLSDDNQVLNTFFGPNVTAEAVDISTGSDRTIVAFNTMDGTGTVSEAGAMNSLLGVNGTGNIINDNTLSKGAPMGIDLNGGSATFHRNRIALFNVWNYGAPIGIRRISGTATIYCDNIVTDIPTGGSAFNVPCIP